MSMEQLPGSLGNYGNVFRDGSTVRRPIGPHSPATTALLDALATTRFQAPIPLGAEAGETQLFEWIDGDVAVPPRPEWSLTDSAIASVSRLLRSYHETVAGLVLPPDLQWATEFADPAGGPIICHNDAGPTNVVFRGGQAVALLDFDYAAPGRAVWDLAQMAALWVKLRPADADPGRPWIDPIPRLRIIVDNYGLDPVDRELFVDALFDSRQRTLAFVRTRVAEGQSPYVETWNRLGGEEGHKRIGAWLLAQRDTILAAISP